MWTIVRFALADGAGYDKAFEILRSAGFSAHRASDPPRACTVLPGAVVGEALQDPSVVSRAVFEALVEARLRPVAVTGCLVPLVRRSDEALASC
jgi:hypothetical protein